MRDGPATGTCSIAGRAGPGRSSAAPAGHLVGAPDARPARRRCGPRWKTSSAGAIDDLDLIDREVLVLRHFEELTNTEVAEVLGIQVKAASIRYVRAVARLKAILSRFPAFEDM